MLTAIQYSVSAKSSSISVAGSTRAANNPHIVHSKMSFLGQSGIDFWISCPTSSIAAVVSSKVKLVNESNELRICYNHEEATKVLLSILRQDASVVDAVRQYLSKNVKHVTPNKEKDVLFGLGISKACPNLLAIVSEYLNRPDTLDMHEKKENAMDSARELLSEISQAGGRVLVKTPRGFVEDDKATAIKRLANQLKRIQFYIQNQLEVLASQRANYDARRLADIEQEAKQLQVLHEAALAGEDMTGMNVQEMILASCFSGKDATPLLKQGKKPVYHFTAKNTSDPREWHHTSDGEPLLASNATLQANHPTAHGGFHKPRNLKDTSNWGTVHTGKGMRHMTTHHGYRGRREFNLLMFTSANKLYPGWKQFKVYSTRNQSGSIWPSCALYTQCFVDPVPCLIVNLKLASDVVDENTKMTVTWMNGKRVNINAKNEGFKIVSTGAITHPQAPLYFEQV